MYSWVVLEPGSSEYSGFSGRTAVTVDREGRGGEGVVAVPFWSGRGREVLRGYEGRSGVGRLIAPAPFPK